MKISEETHLAPLDVDELVAILTATLLITEELRFKTTAQSREYVTTIFPVVLEEIVGVFNAAGIRLCISLP